VPARAYIVAATPRTGSSLLCEGLCATGVAGYPSEPFAPDFCAMWRARWGLDRTIGTRGYVDAALRHGTSANGITAFKIQWMHIAPLARELRLPEDEVLWKLLPGARFVNMVRRDRRAQALSWFRAIATDEWWRFDDAATEPPSPPVLDLDTVRELEAHIEAQQAAWRRYCIEREIVPLTVEYEALDRDYRGEVSRVLRFLGLDPTPARSIPPPRLARQADAVTDGWRRHLELVADGGN
jgi:trehalose 2-sulfotransferase